MPDSEEGAIEDVVRARRLEILDDSDRVRAIVGRLAGGGQREAVIGIAVLDPRGRRRAWLAFDASGPALVFDHAGNNVLYLGVDDEEGDAVHPGPYLELCDRDGATAIGWRVGSEGAVQRLMPEEPWSDDAPA